MAAPKNQFTVWRFPALALSVIKSILLRALLLFLILLILVILYISSFYFSESIRVFTFDTGIYLVNKNDKLNVSAGRIESSKMGHWYIDSFTLNGNRLSIENNNSSSAKPVYFDVLSLQKVNIHFDFFSLVKKQIIFDRFSIDNISINTTHLDRFVAQFSNDQESKPVGDKALPFKQGLFANLPNVFIREIDFSKIEFTQQEPVSKKTALVQNSIKKHVEDDAFLDRVMDFKSPLDIIYLTLNHKYSFSGNAVSLGSVEFTRKLQDTYQYSLTKNNVAAKARFELLILDDKNKSNCNANYPNVGKCYLLKASLDAIATKDNTLELVADVFEPSPWIISKLLKVQPELTNDQPFRLNARFASELLSTGILIQLKHLTMPVSTVNIKAKSQLKITEDLAVELKFAEIKVDKTRHSLSGEIKKDFVKLDLDINELPLNIFNPWVENIDQGSLSVDGNVTGPYSALVGAGQVNASMLFDGLPIKMALDGKMQDNVVSLTNANVNIQDAGVSMKGDIDLYGANTKLIIDAKNIKQADFSEQIQRYIPYDLPSEISDIAIKNVSSRVEGDIKNPNLSTILAASAKLNSEKLLVNISADKQRDVISLKNAIVKLSDTTSTAKGSFNLKSKNIQANFSLSDLDLAILKLANIALPDAFSGYVSTNLVVHGTAQSPEVKGKAMVAGEYQSIPFRVTTNGDFKQKRLKIESLKVDAYNEEVLDGNATINDSTFDANLVINRLPSRLLSAFGVDISPGNFTAQISASGTPLAPNIVGEANYETHITGYDKNGIRGRMPYHILNTIETNDNSLQLKTIFKQENVPAGMLVTSLSLSPIQHYFGEKNKKNAPVMLDASIKGRADISVAHVLLNSGEHEIDGAIDVDLSISGSTNQPIVRGQTHIQDAAYKNLVVGLEFNALNCVMDFLQTSLKVSRCFAKDDDQGVYQVTGYMQAPNNTEEGIPNDSPVERNNVNLTLALDRVNIIKRKEIESQTSGKLALTGNFKNLLVSGVLDVAPLSASIESNLPVNIPSIDVTVVEEFDLAQQAAPKSNLPDINFEIAIKANKQAFLRGRGLDAELAGEIKLLGNANSPEYSGEFHIVRGTLELFNKKFNLTQGRVNLANNAIGLLIVGIYEKNGQTIQVDLSGTNEDINLRLSAIPNLPQDEILANIIFGKNITQITPFQAIQLASAVQTLQGGGNGLDLVGNTRKILGVDTLSVESSTTEDGETGLNVGVGKYLNEKVYLEIQRTPNPSQPWKGNIEIELLPSIKLESSTGGTSGIDGAKIKWKHDY